MAAAGEGTATQWAAVEFGGIPHGAGVAYYKRSGHSTALCSRSDEVIRHTVRNFVVK